MKIRNKVVVEFIISLFLLSGSFKAFAQEYYFQCQSESIPKEAKGIYKGTKDGHMYYVTPDNRTINLLDDKNIKNSDGTDNLKGSGSYDNVMGSIKTISACAWATAVNGLDYTAFDKNGNFYFVADTTVMKNGSLKNFVLYINKYDPVKNKITNYALKENTLFHSMCVSDDGRWIFVDVQEEEDRNSWIGLSRIYGIETTFDKSPVLIYRSYFDYLHTNGTYNLCFDSNTQNLYFCYLGWSAQDDGDIGSGLYILKPDKNGNYLPENLKRKNPMHVYNYERLVKNARKGSKIDYEYFLNTLKYWCEANIKTSEVELNLSYFKDEAHVKIEGKNFSALYKEDENGNPLKELEAVKHIYANKALFLDFIGSFNAKNNRSLDTVPLDCLCYYKATNKPAWNYDADYHNKMGSYQVGYLYSNKDGVWELAKDDDGSVSTSIYQIADNEGNLIGEQVDGLESYHCRSLWYTPKPLIIDYYGFTFLDIDSKNIWRYEDHSVTNVNNRIEAKEAYDFKDLAKVSEIMKAESAEKYRIIAAKEAEENKEKTEQTEKPVEQIKVAVETTDYVPVEVDNADDSLVLRGYAQDLLKVEEKEEELNKNIQSEKAKSKKLLIIVILLVVIIAVLILLLVNRLYAERKQLNLIKNNKKFIFDIQEKERGKISRDIHDSVIQDIRAIRIEAELLKVDEKSEDRKNKVVNLATDCVVKLRNICYNLTPAELATHNQGDSTKIELISIIQSLVIQFIERTHIPCQIKIDENFDYPVLPKEVSQNLFRIIQEALNNIEKHSYATSCQILIKNKIENEKKYMLIYISDDGVGCDVEQMMKKRKKDHFGIGNMLDRAELIGAKIDFQSEVGHGMEVRIEVIG